MSEKDSKETTDTLTVKDYYYLLWRCRDFEIQHLWQRSVFLGVFMVAITAGYGGFINQHIKEVFFLMFVQFDKGCEQVCVQTYLITNIVGLFLSCLGLVVSVLWIMMGKGSKRWYEKYENSIYDLECRIRLDEDRDFKKILLEKKFAEYVTNSERDFPWFGELQDKEVENSLFSTKAGEFSVSKINIFLGQVASCVWFILGALHLFFILSCLGCPENGIIFYLGLAFVTMVTITYLVQLVVVQKTKSKD